MMESLASLSLNAAIEWYETDLSEDIKEFKAKKDIKNQQCAQAEFAKMKEVLLIVIVFALMMMPAIMREQSVKHEPCRTLDAF